MSYRPLLMILAAGPLWLTNAASAQETCKPNYQLTQPACRNSEEVLKVTTVIERKVRVNAGACKVPDAMALCNQHIPLYASQHPGTVRIEASNPSTDNIPELCGPVTKLRQKVDVFCDFTADVPEFRKIADPDCAVENITETNGCFASPTPKIDPASISECIAMKVTTKADLWIKGVCLSDINQAAMNLDISGKDFEQVQSKLSILKSKIQDKPEFAKLNQILNTK